MAVVLLIICALFLFLPLAKQENVDKDLQGVLQAVDSIIDFYQRDYKNLNVDGLFGLRVLEGHLEALVQKHVSGDLQHLDVSVISKLKVMKEKASRTCELSLVHVRRDGQRYYKQMSYVVNNAWSIFDGHRRKINMTVAWSKSTYQTAKRTVFVDEDTSDRCMSELIGSHKSHGKSCDISSKCAHVMTAPGLLGYGITHQILWTMLADKAGCTEKLQARLFELGRGDMTTLRLELCTNNYIQLIEMLQKFTDTLVVPSVQDLFLEQMFVCPSLGYVEFLQPDFLEQILSWQFSTGCYGKMKRSKFSISNLDSELTGGDDNDDDYVDESSKNNNSLKFKQRNDVDGLPDEMMELTKFGNIQNKNRKFENKNDAIWEMPENKGRKLLVEKIMSGGCLAHKTAVASGALIMYLRYLCEPDAKKLFSQKRKLRSVELPSYRGKNEVIRQEQKPIDMLINRQADGITNHDGVDVGHNVPINSVRLGKLNATLNDKHDLMNPIERLEKFHNILKEHKTNSDASVVHKFDPAETQDQNLLSNLGDLKPAYDNDHLAINNLDPNKDDDNYDYKYDDNNEKDDKDINEDYDDEKDDDDDDDGDDDDYPDYNKRDDGKIDRNMNQYYDDNDDNDENEEMELARDVNNDKNDDDDDEYDDDDDDYDDGYDDNDQENVHPHINARNIGRGKSGDYDKDGFDESEKELKDMKDYDVNEDDGDDYEYDDKNDVKEQRHIEEENNEFILAKPDKKVKDSRRPFVGDGNISEQSMLSTTSYVIFAISLVILILFYRFIRKRRIRLRMGNNYFHI